MPAPGLRLGLLAAAALHRAAALQEDLEIWAVGGYSFEPLVGFGFDVGGSYDVQLELTSVGGTGSTCTGVGAGRSCTGSEEALEGDTHKQLSCTESSWFGLTELLMKG